MCGENFDFTSSEMAKTTLKVSTIVGENIKCLEEYLYMGQIIP